MQEDAAKRSAELAEKARRVPQTSPPPLSKVIVEDPINPSYYKGDLVMRIIELFKLDFPLGNAVKYILRSQGKDGVEALRKAKWYLERKIAQLEGTLGEPLK